MLLLRIGKLCIRAWFGVVNDRAVNVLFSTSLKERYIRRIFHAERKLVAWLTHPVVISHSPGHRGSAATAVNELADKSVMDKVAPILI